MKSRAYQYSKMYGDGVIEFDEYARLMIPVLNGSVPNKMPEAVQLTLF